jgi:phosphoribosylformimino-5-aminoimidazole carboxamide ribotide isomerase
MMADIEHWLKAGVARVILGSAAVKNPDLVREAARAHPGRIAVGIDAREGRVATEGWAETSTLTAIDLAKNFEQAGVAAIIYTDIARDGMLEGVNIAATLALADQVQTPLIASGGIGGAADLNALRRAADDRLEGVVVGRALYDGALDVATALAILGSEDAHG